MLWLKEEKIAHEVRFLGRDLFECILTGSFMNKMSDKEIFGQ